MLCPTRAWNLREIRRVLGLHTCSLTLPPTTTQFVRSRVCVPLFALLGLRPPHTIHSYSHLD